MKKILVCISFAASLLLLSCHSKNDPMSELYALTEQISEDTSEYTEENRVTVDNQLEMMETELQQYSGRYSDEEMKEIGRLKGKCIGLITKKNKEFCGKAVRRYI